jgi:hypothetical protein
MQVYLSGDFTCGCCSFFYCYHLTAVLVLGITFLPCIRALECNSSCISTPKLQFILHQHFCIIHPVSALHGNSYFISALILHQHCCITSINAHLRFQFILHNQFFITILLASEKILLYTPCSRGNWPYLHLVPEVLCTRGLC